jgi:hypothetical protein
MLTEVLSCDVCDGYRTKFNPSSHEVRS